jgi:hypothetical protein
VRFSAGQQVLLDAVAACPSCEGRGHRIFYLLGDPEPQRADCRACGATGKAAKKLPATIRRRVPANENHGEIGYELALAAGPGHVHPGARLKVRTSGKELALR